MPGLRPKHWAADVSNGMKWRAGILAGVLSVIAFIAGTEFGAYKQRDRFLFGDDLIKPESEETQADADS